MSSLLSTAARTLALPAVVSGPWAAVLVPALLYVATRREVLMSLHLR